ncbi:MAG: hypothetical protein AAGE52_14025 [Myxococcota bacterium]
MNVFDLIHDLQWLRAKRAMVPLDHGEAARLAQLDHMVSPKGEEEPTLIRMLRPCPCLLALPGRGFIGAKLRVMSGDGFVLTTDEKIAEGDRVIVHVDSEGSSYAFPCRVSDTNHGLTVTLEGVPTRQADNAA